MQDLNPFSDLLEALKPDLIAPVVAWLCHEDCDANGNVIEAAGGWAGKCKPSFAIKNSDFYRHI